MASFEGGEVKVLKPGDPVGINAQKPKAHIEFDVYSDIPCRFIVSINKDGSWVATHE